jgi:hypothetical protein
MAKTAMLNVEKHKSGTTDVQLKMERMERASPAKMKNPNRMTRTASWISILLLVEDLDEGEPRRLFLWSRMAIQASSMTATTQHAPPKMPRKIIRTLLFTTQ